MGGATMMYNNKDSVALHTRYWVRGYATYLHIVVNDQRSTLILSCVVYVELQ